MNEKFFIILSLSFFVFVFVIIPIVVYYNKKNENAGQIGPIGITGSIGPIGPLGPIGPSGGPIGPIGPIGPSGGPAGPIGLLGPIGPIGPSGGPIGPIGPSGGPAGPIGPIGPAGGVTSINSTTGSIILQSSDFSVWIEKIGNVLDLSSLPYIYNLPDITTKLIQMGSLATNVYEYRYENTESNLIAFLMTQSRVKAAGYSEIMSIEPFNATILNFVSNNNAVLFNVILSLHSDENTFINLGLGTVNSDSGIVIPSNENNKFYFPLDNPLLYTQNSFIRWKVFIFQATNTGSYRVQLSNISFRQEGRYAFDSGITIT